LAALNALVSRDPTGSCRCGHRTVAYPVRDDDLGGLPQTRTLELTVHTCDLAAALSVSADVPQEAVADAFAVIGGLAAVQVTASAALRA